jgi:hypothetical protein
LGMSSVQWLLRQKKTKQSQVQSRLTILFLCCCLKICILGFLKLSWSNSLVGKVFLKFGPSDHTVVQISQTVTHFIHLELFSCRSCNCWSRKTVLSWRDDCFWAIAIKQKTTC